MSRRLSDRAFQILLQEVQRCAAASPAGQVQQQIVLRRLERLRMQPGTPVSETELQDAVRDIFPEFRVEVIRQAIRANRPPNPWIKVGVVSLGGVLLAAGGLYILNLPYPMIRWPVARTMPLVLLPSFASMDHHYRQAISLVAQADQLVNQATSAADFELGTTKVKKAQTSLDALPVWFLGYYPQAYCQWFTCGWRFTVDEFQQARAHIGRMEAKLFQEKNAQTLLSEGEAAVQTAKQQYEQAQTLKEKTLAIAAWQAAVDMLAQIPTQTLAGQMAQTRLLANKRDLQQVAIGTAGGTRSSNLIEVAKQFALQAAQLSQNPPHTATKWQEVLNFWQTAIDRLSQVSTADVGYVEAQQLLATYEKNMSMIRIRLKTEQESTAALEDAQRQIQSLLAGQTNLDRDQMSSQVTDIINHLNKVKPGTTAYQEAQTLKQSAQEKYQQLQSQNSKPNSAR